MRLFSVQVSISELNIMRVHPLPADSAVEVGALVQFDVTVATGSGITFTFRSNDANAAQEEIVGNIHVYFCSCSGRKKSHKLI